VIPDFGTCHRFTRWLAGREPFDGQALLRFLAARAIPGVEEVSRGRYARTVRVPGGWGLVELLPPAAHAGAGGQAGDRAIRHRPAAGPGRAGEARVLLRARLTSPRGIGQVVSRCRRLFDLDADPQAIDATLAADGTLAPLVAAHPGLRVPGAYDGFELAVRAVIGQQVSVAGASTLTGRLAARCGTPLGAAGTAGPGDTGRPAGTTRPNGTAGPAGPLTVLFPTPADLAGADLAGLGLTTARQVTLRALAAACADGRLNLDPGTDPEETAARLAALPGVGPWTVAYILLRAVGDPDAFPASDLGLRRAMERLGCRPGQDGRWRPWRAYAAVHLWASLAGPAAPTAPAARPASGDGPGTQSVMPSASLAANGRE
jgi:AraC family transcriptional regulator, regulatory protein of adaptative response / DNA-3-methyladenine glycosylase II